MKWQLKKSISHNYQCFWQITSATLAGAIFFLLDSWLFVTGLVLTLTTLYNTSFRSHDLFGRRTVCCVLDELEYFKRHFHLKDDRSKTEEVTWTGTSSRFIIVNGTVLAWNVILPSKPQSSDAPAAGTFASETQFRWTAAAGGQLSLLDRPYFTAMRSRKAIFIRFKRACGAICWPSHVRVAERKRKCFVQSRDVRGADFADVTVRHQNVL